MEKRRNRGDPDRGRSGCHFEVDGADEDVVQQHSALERLLLGVEEEGGRKCETFVCSHQEQGERGVRRVYPLHLKFTFRFNPKRHKLNNCELNFWKKINIEQKIWVSNLFREMNIFEGQVKVIGNQFYRMSFFVGTKSKKVTKSS